MPARCCPTGAKCTGTVSSGIASLGSAAATTTSSSGPPPTTAAATSTTGTASIFSNTYFPFPYVPQTYINSAACNSAYLACQSNYAACTHDLQQNSFGVTIVAPNGAGTTVAPTAAQSLPAAAATSICSSLSSVACYDIQSDDCAAFGTATSTGGDFIVGMTSNPAARPTVGCMVAVGVVAGVGLGIAGQLV